MSRLILPVAVPLSARLACLFRGHEPSAVDYTFGSWRGFRDTVVATVTGRL